MLEGIHVTSIFFTLKVITLLLFCSSIFAKDCADVCGKVKEPSPYESNHNELSQCKEKEKLKSTR